MMMPSVMGKWELHKKMTQKNKTQKEKHKTCDTQFMSLVGNLEHITITCSLHH